MANNDDSHEYWEERRKLAAYPKLVAALRELMARADEAEANHIPVKARKIQELCAGALAGEPEVTE